MMKTVITQEIRYAANLYNHVAQDADGISGIRYERDDLGRVIRKYWLTFTGAVDTSADNSANFEVIGKGNAEAGVTYIYNESDDLIEERRLDINGEPVLNTKRGSIARSEFENHNKVKESYLTPEGEPFIIDEGYAIWENVYDDHGNIIKGRSLGTDGRPTVFEEGYAVRESIFDDHGNIIRQSYLGTDGQPVLNVNGVAAIEGVYDDHGNIIRQCFYGTEGQPVLNSRGFAGFEMTYDQHDNRTRERYFGLDGSPTTNDQWFAEVAYSYDERDHCIEKTITGLTDS